MEVSTSVAVEIGAVLVLVTVCVSTGAAVVTTVVVVLLQLSLCSLITMPEDLPSDRTTFFMTQTGRIEITSQDGAK